MAERKATGKLEAQIIKDGRQVALTLRRGTARFSASELDETIERLWKTRIEMSPAPPFEPPQTIHWRFDPRWRLAANPDRENLPWLVLRHDGAGWLSFVFPAREAQALGTALIKLSREKLRFKTVAEKTDFLITTHGGAYFYGENGQVIGPDPFEQMESDSDRAAGIVAGAIVERTLELAVMKALESTSQKLKKNRTFADLIKMSLELRLLSPKAKHEIGLIKDIRNIFAHELEIDSFDNERVSSLCAQMSLIDTIIGPMVPFGDDPHDVRSYAGERYGIANHEEHLKNPRFRYVRTAQEVSFKLGMASKASPVPAPVF